MRLMRRRALLLAAGASLAGCLGAVVWRQLKPSRDLEDWFSRPASRSELITDMGLALCPNASFLFPSPGYIGLLWGDTRLPYSAARPHSGIDVFGDGEPGRVPVYAAYDGYLTRLAGWKSAVIIRHPQDPLEPSRQIWSYYAHMADEAGDSFIAEQYPPGSTEVPIAQGTLLGYQGIYNGGTGRVGLHLHFSLVRDDRKGRFLNETDIRNTLDPSPYMGMRLSHTCADRVPHCTDDAACG